MRQANYFNQRSSSSNIILVDSNNHQPGHTQFNSQQTDHSDGGHFQGDLDRATAAVDLKAQLDDSKLHQGLLMNIMHGSSSEGVGTFQEQ